MSDVDIKQIATNKTNIEGLKGDIGTILEWIRRVEDKVEKALEAARKRPGWAVCTIIALLSSASTGLLIALLNHLQHGG